MYCALVVQREPTPTAAFERGVRLAVNHGGDSDSTGSITGNILGTLFGKEAIPGRWLDQLELRDEIETVAVDMYLRFIDPGAIRLDLLVVEGNAMTVTNNPAYTSQAADLERHPPW